MTSFGISLIPFAAGERCVVYSMLSNEHHFPAFSLEHQERDIARAAIDCVGPLDPARQASDFVAQPMRQLRVGHPKHFAKLHACIGDDEVEEHSGARVCKKGGIRICQSWKRRMS